MYFLASASLLAVDLARHPSGAAVADVADRVLTLQPDELAALRDPVAHEVRERVLAVCAQPRMSTLMDGVTGTVAGGLPPAEVSRAVVATMAQTLVGGLADLHSLLLREQPLSAAAPPAVQAALDAVTVAWAGRAADLHDLARLRAPWAAAVDPVPPALPDTLYGEQLTSLLEQVSRRRPEQWQAVVRAHRGLRRQQRWSELMHAASVAAHQAGLLVEVARAQLAAARALRLSGASTGPDAHAVAMAVTAAVQGVCTAHLLDTSALMSAWSAGT